MTTETAGGPTTYTTTTRKSTSSKRRGTIPKHYIISAVLRPSCCGTAPFDIPRSDGRCGHAERGQGRDGQSGVRRQEHGHRAACLRGRRDKLPLRRRETAQETSEAGQGDEDKGDVPREGT